MSDKNAGHALDSEALYKHQQNKAKPYAPTIIAIDLVTPANIGSIYRLADATAAEKIIFVQKEPRAFESNKTVIRTSRHTHSRVASEYWSFEKFISDYQSLPELIAVELTSTAQNILTCSLPQVCSFVIGSERYGVPDHILNICQRAVQVPMLGANGSMNVSHALAVCLYQWHRQHTDFNAT